MSEEIPVVPKRPTRRSTAQSLDNGSNSDVPLSAQDRVLLESKTQPVISSETDLENEPMIPVQRPVRTSTTQELHDLIESTNDQLNEIQELVNPGLEKDSKNRNTEVHNEKPEKVEGSSEEPLVPKRPLKQTPVSSDESERANTETNGEPAIPRRPVREHVVNAEVLKMRGELVNKEESVAEEEPFVPPRPIKKTETAKGSELEVELKSEQEPSIPTRPIKRNVAEEDSELEQKVEIEEDSVVDKAPATEEELEAQGEPSIPTRPIKRSDVEEKSEEKKVPEVEKESLVESEPEADEKPSIPTRPIKRSDVEEKLEPEKEPEVNEEPEPEKELESEKEPSIPKRPIKKPKENIEELESEPVNQQESAQDELKQKEMEEKTEEPIIPRRPTKESFKANEESSEDKDDSPVVPNERPQKKKTAPPPIPKKPSSRIAAFQKMIEEQQLQNMQNNNKSQDSLNELQPVKSSSNSISNKAQQLNGLFALPGMMPMGGLPKSLAKKLQPAGSESTTTNEPKNKRRAKGPKGRKLPKDVANVEKINIDEHQNIEVFKMWTVTFTKLESPQPNQEQEQQFTELQEELTEIKSNVSVITTEDEDQPTEETQDDDGIQDRDQLVPTETLERELEDKLEFEMQQQILKDESYNLE